MVTTSIIRFFWDSGSGQGLGHRNQPQMGCPVWDGLVLANLEFDLPRMIFVFVLGVAGLS